MAYSPLNKWTQMDFTTVLYTKLPIQEKIPLLMPKANNLNGRQVYNLFDFKEILEFQGFKILGEEYDAYKVLLPAGWKTLVSPESKNVINILDKRGNLRYRCKIASTEIFPRFFLEFKEENNNITGAVMDGLFTLRKWIKRPEQSPIDFRDTIKSLFDAEYPDNRDLSRYWEME